MAAIASAGSTLVTAAGDPGQCSDQPGESGWELAVRAMTPKWKAIDGLQANDFGVTVNRAPQKVCGVTHMRRPISAGIVLDTSGSLQLPSHDFSLATSAVEDLLSVSGPQDEYFLDYANRGAAVRAGFTRDLFRIRTGLTLIPYGRLCSTRFILG